MWYVYVDYTRDRLPFYIGKGNLKRVQLFERNAKHAAVRKKHGHLRMIVFETASEREAFNHEIYLIRTLKTFQGDYPDTLASNFTRGGDGPTGYRHTEATLQRLREMSTGVIPSPETIAKRRAKNIGRKRTPDQCNRMSLVQSGKTKSPEHRAKIAQTLMGRPTGRKGIPHTPAARAAICAAVAGKQGGELNGFFGKKHTAETRLKMSESAKKRKVNRPRS